MYQGSVSPIATKQKNPPFSRKRRVSFPFQKGNQDLGLFYMKPPSGKAANDTG